MFTDALSTVTEVGSQYSCLATQSPATSDLLLVSIGDPSPPPPHTHMRTCGTNENTQIYTNKSLKKRK